MGNIELTFCGDWKKLPDIETRFQMSFFKRDGELTQDILFVGQRADCLESTDISRIRAHRGVIRAELSFDAEDVHKPAKAALELARQLFECGGSALFVEHATKVFTQKTLSEITTDEPRFLFHFLVEVFGNKTSIQTAGMTSFALPDVRVNYTAESLGPAQAAAFNLAARMVCDGFEPISGGVFRASESAPLYEICRNEDATSENRLGIWELSLAKS